MSDINIPVPTPYLQKDIIERQVVTESSLDRIRAAIEYIAETGYTPGGRYVTINTWEPPKRY